GPYSLLGPRRASGESASAIRSYKRASGGQEIRACSFDRASTLVRRPWRAAHPAVLGLRAPSVSPAFAGSGFQGNRPFALSFWNLTFACSRLRVMCLPAKLLRRL